MGEPTSNRATLRNKFELEKFRSKVVKSQPEIESSSPSNCTQKQKSTEIEEIVKHMKHLPSFLETGKPIQERALSFGVIDWARLEKWQYQQRKPGLIKSNKCSPSSSNSSSLFSTDGSSPRSSRDQSCSPRPKAHRVTLQAHFKASPKEDSRNDLTNSHTPPSKGKLKIFQENVQDSSSRTCPQTGLDFSRKTSNNSNGKPRSTSPLRRFSFSLSTGSKSESPVSQKSTTDTNRSHSSPLRRLLDPIFPSKTHQFTDTCHEDSRTKPKTKLDFKNETRVDDASSSSSRKQALFQTTVKNDRLLFTFAVENDKEILAATVTNINSSVKNNNNNLLYTFFTVHEVKKKNITWLSHGNKSKDHGYVPNITAQMKVSNSRFDTREFVLFSVNSNVQPQEELEAIVVKLLRKANGDENQERFDATVVLPGGSHGVPSKGDPLTPLIDRWRSGGVCDCGGWDEGCRLRTLYNRVQSHGSRLDKVHMSARPFELFFQGEVQNNKPIFSLSPLKEGIFSVDYNSSLSPLQAFSICISVVEPRKTSQNTQIISHAHKDVPIIYTPIPRIKKNTIGKVTF